MFSFFAGNNEVDDGIAVDMLAHNDDDDVPADVVASCNCFTHYLLANDDINVNGANFNGNNVS